MNAKLTYGETWRYKLIFFGIQNMAFSISGDHSIDIILLHCIDILLRWISLCKDGYHLPYPGFLQLTCILVLSRPHLPRMDLLVLPKYMTYVPNDEMLKSTLRF